MPAWNGQLCAGLRLAAALLAAALGAGSVAMAGDALAIRDSAAIAVAQPALA